MKLYPLDRSSKHDTSFTITQNEGPHFLKIWHYHPELELVLVRKSKGTCFVGDGMASFDVGDVFLIGKNLPHIWLNNDKYFCDDKKRTAKAIAVHFNDDFLGEPFFKTPEMTPISQLINRSAQGIRFVNVNKTTIREIRFLLDKKGFDKTILFLKLLHQLAHHSNYQQLASHGFVQSYQLTTNHAIDRVMAHIFKNFTQPISLQDAANIANMHPASFSRFFKRLQKKSLTAYLSELRIGYACKLMLERQSTIASICYEVGFNNLSNFNRQFKARKKCTPKEFIARHNSTTVKTPNQS